jgi:hypothetical protein
MFSSTAMQLVAAMQRQRVVSRQRQAIRVYLQSWMVWPELPEFYWKIRQFAHSACESLFAHSSIYYIYGYSIKCMLRMQKFFIAKAITREF